MKTHTQQFLQKRKLAMALPVLTMPFLTLIFWALGGGQATPGQAVAMNTAGLNLELPSAHFSPDEKTDKFSLYEESQRDSADFFEAVENDPYFELNTMVLEDKEDEPLFNTLPKMNKAEDMDPNEAKVNEKLELIYRELNRAPMEATSARASVQEQNLVPPVEHEQFTDDVSKLEGMMEMMAVSNEPDPEMVQMGTMLDKILDIQHPERVKERIREQSIQHQEQVFSVSAETNENTVSMIAPSSNPVEMKTDSDSVRTTLISLPTNGFYGLEEETQTDQQDNAIPAVIHDTQELVAGSTVKLRLISDIYLNGQLISKDQFIYGTASINEERLNISINSIRSDNSLFSVALTVYDLDGMEGLYIPGAISRDVAKQSTDQGLQGMQFMSMDQTLTAQAASAGIEAAKGLFSKKVKLIKVTVKAGYLVLLKDTNARQ